MGRSDDLNEKIDTLQMTVDAMARGMGAMLDTLQTHSEMLAKIMEACAVDPGGSELSEALEDIASALAHQNETLAVISKSLDGIGSGIELSVMRGVARALDRVDEDGVVKE